MADKNSRSRAQWDEGIAAARARILDVFDNHPPGDPVYIGMPGDWRISDGTPFLFDELIKLDHHPDFAARAIRDAIQGGELIDGGNYGSTLDGGQFCIAAVWLSKDYVLPGQPPTAETAEPDDGNAPVATTLTTNDRMMAIFTRDKRCIDWTLREWEEKVEAKKSTIQGTPTWAVIVKEREDRKPRAVDRHRTASRKP